MNKQLDNMRVYFTVLRMSNSLQKKQIEIRQID